MPNWCSIEIRCKMSSVNQTELFIKGMCELIRAHNTLREATCVNGVWMHDARIDSVSDTEILFDGEVKWSIDDYDANNIGEYLSAHGAIDDNTINYEELGMGLKGTYTFNVKDHSLKCKSLKMEDFPPYPDDPNLQPEEYDRWHDELEKALEEKGIIEENFSTIKQVAHKILHKEGLEVKDLIAPALHTFLR